MAELPYMQFFPSDWMADCQVLSLAGRGAWQTIICKAWHPSTRGVVTLKLPALARLFGATVEQTERVIAEIEETGVADVLHEGDTVTITSRRIVREWEKRTQERRALSEGGKLGAFRRWGKNGQDSSPPDSPPNREPNSPPIGQPTSRPMAIQKLEARSYIPPVSPEGGGSTAAEDLWQAHEWGHMDQEQAFALLTKNFPGIDVWGEFNRFKEVRANKGQKPTWKPFIGWLQKATPVVNFGKKNPAKVNAALLPSEADWRAFIASEYPDAKDPGPPQDAQPDLLLEFRRWKEKNL